jgi:hypothetical protein
VFVGALVKLCLQKRRKGMTHTPEPQLNRHDVEFLSILCGDVDGGSWGAWMTACAEYLKNTGHVVGHYQISEKGLAYLDMLQFWNAPAEGK